MIPQERRAAVTRGLREAFDVSTFEDISPVTGGHTSSLVFRIVVDGAPFLLKIILRTDDPTCHFTCMKAAADAGQAPQVRYTSVEDRILITDFVEPAAFPVSHALVRMPRALRSLHALAPFPERASHLNTSCTFLINKGPAVDRLIGSFEAAKALPKSETAQLFAWHALVGEVYTRLDADMVSSHNDLFKPDNVLFDGERVWLVDWEAAFLNDRYADLAVVANLVVTNDAEERAYLAEYFGQPPDEYQLARFFLMRQLAHIFYAMVFLWLGSSGEPVKQSEETSEFTAFHRRMWAGEVDLGDKQMKRVYGRVHWERLVENMRGARFEEAVRIVSG